MDPIVTIESLRHQLDSLERDGFLADDELILTVRENGGHMVTLAVALPDNRIETTGVQFAGMTEV